ncbi:NAD-dependent formate dehydrogenase [Pholiota molesta]|nr:NAD-dependent formate dehydrogenase [Pholiota molesta]
MFHNSIYAAKVLAILYEGGPAAQQESRLLGTVENQSQGHEFIVSSSKEGPDSVFQKELPDVCQEPQNCVTAGVGSDHIDLNSAIKRGIPVLEVSGSNVVSVAEHAVMTMLILVKNFLPAHEMIERGEWQVSQGKVVGTIGAGRIGFRILQRVLPFNVKENLYYDYVELKPELAAEVKARRVEDLKDFVSQCDIVTINCPLHEQTKGLVNAELLKHFKKGDVWDKQPAPKEHIWRTMKNPLGAGNAMVPHYSGTSLDAQKRYADGTRKILENFFAGKPRTSRTSLLDLAGTSRRLMANEKPVMCQFKSFEVDGGSLD